MKKYIFKRILWLIPSIIIVSFLVFYLMDLAPGTIVDQMISGDMTQEEIDEERINAWTMEQSRKLWGELNHRVY